MKIVLIPCAGTEWQEQGRLLGRAELPPGPAAEEECLHWGDELRPVQLQQIYHAPDELATRTARWLGRKLAVPVRVARSLAEVDLGLWTGLTEAELESRYSSAHRELCDAPLHVSPPAGESFADADRRLRAFLRKQLKRNGERAFGLVLRPVSLALARCALEGQKPCLVWPARLTRAPVIIELRNGRWPAGEPGLSQPGRK